MESIPKSGLYYPNKIAMFTMLALEDVMGKNGLNAVLNLAGLSHLIGNYPPNNLNREFDFSDLSAINGALLEMYGPRGARGLALKAGSEGFDKGIKDFGALAGVGDMAFKVLPLQAKLKFGIPAMAKVFSSTSDQHSTCEEKSDHFVYTMHKCPVCWGRESDGPICWMAMGLVRGLGRWIGGEDLELRVQEAKCHAAGDEACVLIIHKP